MPFRAGGEDEFPDRIPAAAEYYRLRVESYTFAKTKPNKFDPEGNKDEIRFLLDFVAIADDEDADLLGTDGLPLREDARVMFFFDPNRLGLKPQVSKNRRFLAAALGIPNEQPVEYESMEAMAQDMVDREVIAAVKVNGSYNNIDHNTLRPVRKKRAARAEKPSLTEAAAEVFKDEVAETKEVDADDEY
jgi:hypothetical protein